jgi:hypothetical protein
MHPPTCRSARSRADRCDPPRPHAQTLLARGGTHISSRLMSAESELGTLPVSKLLLRALHTRIGLGRSAMLRRTHSNDVPLRYPRTVTMGGVPLEYSVVTSRARVPSESTATALLPQPPPLDAPDMHPPTCRALGAEPTDPTPHQPHARTPWQEGGTHSCTRLVSAESELGTLPVSVLSLSSLHTRSRLGRSAVLRRTHSNHVPLRYPRTVPMGGGAP